jgi:hypothetical protein
MFEIMDRKALLAALLATGLAAGQEGGPAGSCWPGAPGTDPGLCPPNDPGLARHWEYRGDLPPELDRSRIHPAELALGSIGISLDRAWQRTTGRDDVTIAVLDSGIRWGDRDLLLKLALNRGDEASCRFRTKRRRTTRTATGHSTSATTPRTRASPIGTATGSSIRAT